MNMRVGVALALSLCLPVVAGVTNITSGGAVQLTIQAAINAAANGDTLLVSTGVYGEQVVVSAKVVRVVGNWLPDFASQTSNCEDTIVDGGMLGSVVSILSNAVVTLEWLCIRNGSNDYGGGIYADAGTVLTARQCNVTANGAAVRGGGIYASGMAMLFADGLRVEDNHSGYGGGGLYIENATYRLENTVVGSAPDKGNSTGTEGGGLSISLSSGTVVNCMIEANSADFSGGVVVEDTNTFLMRNTTVRGNRAGDQAGGICFGGTHGSCLLDHVAVVSNTAYGSAGIFGTSSETITMTNGCVVAGNTAASMGGGIGCDKAAFEIHGCDISGNTASNSVAGISVVMGSAHIVDSTICNNRAWLDPALEGEGCALFAMKSAQVTVEAIGRSVVISNNSSFIGAGVLVGSDSSCVLLGRSAPVVVEGNTAARLGGGMACGGATVQCVGAVRFSRNTAAGGGGIYAEESVVTLMATNGAAPSFAGNCSVGTNTDDGGGAIVATRGSQLVVGNASFMGNASSNHAGAIWLQNSQARMGGQYAGGPNGILPPVVLSNNVAPWGSGGAIYMTDASTATIADVFLVDNTALVGGGIGMQTSAVYLVNAVLYRNSSGVSPDSSFVRSLHCTIISNGASGLEGTGMHSVTNSIVLGHSTNIAAGNDVQYSIVGGGYPTGAGNMSTNPVFMSMQGMDFRQRLESPGINAGVPTWLGTDAIGVARPQGSAPDMGAYETELKAVQSVVPLTYNFGDVGIGDTAQTRLAVLNSGNISLTGSVVNFWAPYFTFAPGTYSAPAFGSTDVTVTFLALTNGFTWTNVVNFAGNGGTTVVTVCGTGVPEPVGTLFVIGYSMLVACGVRRRVAAVSVNSGTGGTPVPRFRIQAWLSECFLRLLNGGPCSVVAAEEKRTRRSASLHVRRG